MAYYRDSFTFLSEGNRINLDEDTDHWHVSVNMLMSLLLLKMLGIS
jgi:hypothetical protein